MKKKIAIFDLDGTIAIIDHRRNLVDGDVKKWNEFYKACVDDTPNIPIIEIARALKLSGWDVWIFSGRSNEVSDITVGWLVANGVGFIDYIKMREAGDFTPDDELKQKWINTMLDEDRERLQVVFDDRDKVVQMWRRNGITCCQVADGKF